MSATLLSLMGSSFTDKIYGFPIKEIINFQTATIKISKIVPASLIIIFLSSFFLAINYINTVVALLILMLLMVTAHSSHIWEIVTSEIYCFDSIKKETDAIISGQNDKKIFLLINKLCDDYIIKIQAKNIKESDEVLAIIDSIICKIHFNTQTAINLNEILGKMFYETTYSLGYSPAIEKILNIYCKNNMLNDIDRSGILVKPIEMLRYINDKELLVIGLPIQVNAFSEIKILKKNEKIFFLYQYFKNIYQNNIITQKLRRELLEEYLEKLCDFRWSSENEYIDLHGRIIIHIFKDFVLLNKNQTEREFVFLTILKSVYGDGYCKGKTFNKTLSLIIQSLYFYIFYEIETLSENHRDELNNLVSIYNDSIDMKTITFRNFYETYRKEIVEGLFDISLDIFTNYSFMEYFPKNSGAKSVIWSDDNSIRFAFINYLLNWHYFEKKSFQLFESWDIMSFKEKKRVLIILLGCFDKSTKILDNRTQKEANELSEWLKLNNDLSEKFLHQLFDTLNLEMQNVNSEISNMIEEKIPKLEMINEKMTIQLRDYRKCFGYDSSYFEGIIIEKRLERLIEEKEYCNNELHVTAKISRYIEFELNKLVNDNFKVIDISFDQDGVENLLKHLLSKRYDSRNYTFIDDISLSKETRDSNSYNELSKLIKEMNWVNTKPYQSYSFFNEKDMKFNVKITEYNLNELSEEELNLYVEKFKTAEGIYEVESAIYNKSGAIRIIRESYRSQDISFKLYSNINENSGTRVLFKRKKLNN